MTFGERIYKIRTEKGLTQDELATAVGYKSRSTIAKIESGERDAPQTMIVALAKALGTTPSYLMGWDDDAIETYKFLDTIIDPEHTSAQVKEQDKAIRRIINSSEPYLPEKMIPIPVIGRVAAGYTCLAETDIECYELVNSEVLNSGYEYVYLKVVGDSMEPLILEGDLVLVRLQEIVESGDYAVVIVDEEDGVVKQIEFDNDCIKLISQNPYYPPRIFKGKSRERVRIYGKVVESKRKFN